MVRRVLMGFASNRKSFSWNEVRYELVLLSGGVEFSPAFRFINRR